MSSQNGYAETKLRCRMQDDNDDLPTAMRLINGGGAAAAQQTVTASVAELTRKVEQTEAQLRAQLRLNLLLVVINLVTLVMVYLYAGQPVSTAAPTIVTDGGMASPPPPPVVNSPVLSDEL
jgi:hypothetical protein